MVTLIFKEKLQLEIVGEEPEARRVMAARRPVAVKARRDGRTIIVRGHDVILAEIITAAEEATLAEMARAKAEAERKANPNPGRAPKLVIPDTRIIHPR